jgi:hypothetical protein
VTDEFGSYFVDMDEFGVLEFRKKTETGENQTFRVPPSMVSFFQRRIDELVESRNP